MAEWTRMQARKVLECGDWLRVTHPSYPDEELLIRHTEDGFWVAYREKEGEDGLMDVDERVDSFLWGTFDIVGFCWVGDTAHGVADDDPRWQELKRELRI